MNPSSPSPRSLSVLFIAADLSSGGGVNRVIRDLAVLFKRRLGMDVRVVNARSGQSSAYSFPEDVPVEWKRSPRLLSYLALLLKLRRSRPQTVISSWTHDNILTVLAFAFSRSKVILIEHTSWNHHGVFIRMLRRLTYPFADRLVVLNPAELKHYRQFLSNVRLLPNPVVSEAHSPDGPREKLILAVGHLERRKNFADAIRAMTMSGLEDHGWSLAIIGSGEQSDHLKSLIAELGLKRTSIHQPVPDLSELYARASLTLVTAGLEVFSLALAEAMLSGVVPIAYATDGPSFILEEFADHLVPIGDVKRLAGRLIHFANAPEPEPLRQALKMSIERRFGEDVVAQSWKDLLYEVTPAESRA